tara:strand:- start:40 stop:1107 length:1068 start_codon:yes stop_codon:yes gene_type:complete
VILGKKDVKNASITSVLNNLQYIFNPASVIPYPAPPPDIAIPDDWEIHKQPYYYNHSQKEADLFLSPAKTEEPKGTVFYSLGWKTHPLDKIDVIENLQAEGYNVITMPLVESNSTIGTMGENIVRMENVLFNENSALHKLRDPNSSLGIITHSTSCTVYEIALQFAKTEGLYLPDQDNTVVIHTNPFINARGASRSEDPHLSKIYRWHANRNLNEHAGIPLMDRLFYVASGLGQNLQDEDPRERPTHGQILEISAYGDHLLETYNFAERSDPPVIAFISNNDDFASPAVAKKYFGNKENTRHIYEVNAKHNVLLELDLREKVIEILDRNASKSGPNYELPDIDQPIEHYQDGYAL